MSAAVSAEKPAPPLRIASDLPFLLGLSILGGLYLVLIVAMLLADLAYTSPFHLLQALGSREIQYAIKLSLISCSITTILSMWVAVPLGYLMSRYDFFGKWLVDAALDIPIVLPPLVVGLSLLILFHTPPGRALEALTQRRMGFMIAYLLVPFGSGLFLAALCNGIAKVVSARRPPARLIVWLVSCVLSALVLAISGGGEIVDAWAQRRFATPITYAVPSVILAQFSVACAFAVRTMRVTFDQINPRTEQVALTLGCTRAQAFWMVVLPEARRGLLTAGTLAWARSLGEFGPILIFSGATRMKTEVLSTTVFLELSVGNLEAAVAVSLIMVVAALVVLVIVRLFGLRGSGAI